MYEGHVGGQAGVLGDRSVIHAVLNQSFERRDAVFAALRRYDPVSWQPPVREVVAPDPDDPGYWALVKHADIVAVSRDRNTFISGRGVQFDLLPPSVLEMSQSFLVMDSGRHERLRKLVSVAFSPRQIKLIEAQIRAAAREVEPVAAAPNSPVGVAAAHVVQLENRTIIVIQPTPTEHIRQAHRCARARRHIGATRKVVIDPSGHRTGKANGDQEP